MGWVIVEFPGTREVFVDDRSQGNNRDEGGLYRTLIVQDGLHTFRLGGKPDPEPASQDAQVRNTSALDPPHVVFKRV